MLRYSSRKNPQTIDKQRFAGFLLQVLGNWGIRKSAKNSYRAVKFLSKIDRPKSRMFTCLLCAGRSLHQMLVRLQGNPRTQHGSLLWVSCHAPSLTALSRAYTSPEIACRSCYDAMEGEDVIKGIAAM